MARRRRVATYSVEELVEDMRKFDGETRRWYAKAAARVVAEHIAELIKAPIKQDVIEFCTEWNPFAIVIDRELPGLHLYDAERCGEIACGAMLELGRAQEELRLLRESIRYPAATTEAKSAESQEASSVDLCHERLATAQSE